MNLQDDKVNKEIIALLGQRQLPVDGVADYCDRLQQQLAKQGYTLKQVRLPWHQIGWVRSLSWVWQESTIWQGKWVLVQYTAGSWSWKAIPLTFLVMLIILRLHRVRLAVIFHDQQGYPGKRPIDRVRRTLQHSIMRTAYAWAEKSILTMPAEAVPWLRPNSTKTVTIPVGANIPEPSQNLRKERPNNQKTIAVFGVFDVNISPREANDIAYTVKRAAQQISPLHLIVLGRGSQEAKQLLEEELQTVNVTVSVLGLLPPEQISQTLFTADVLLFVRPLSTGRTTAMAGIACGLPLVAYGGAETKPPVTEAGVLLAPIGDREALAEALVRVLKEDNLWLDLHQRSIEAQQKHFSWNAITDKFLKVLANEQT